MNKPLQLTDHVRNQSSNTQDSVNTDTVLQLWLWTCGMSIYILKFLTRCPTPARAIYTFAVAASTTPVLNLSPVSTTADLLYVTKAECVRVYQNIADRINRRETTKQCWPRREIRVRSHRKNIRGKGRTPSRLTINTFRSIQHLTAMKIQYAVKYYHPESIDSTRD